MLSSILADYNNTYTFLKKLEGYGSQNYLVECSQSKKYILKYYSDLSTLKQSEAENRVLHETNSFNNNLKLPLPIQSIKFHDKGFSRVISYIEGALLGEVDLNSDLIKSFGNQCGQLINNLAQIEEPFYEYHQHNWDILEALNNLPFISSITNQNDKKYVQYHLDHFKYFTLPILSKFQKQLIHGDLNDWNIVIQNSKVVGFFDFGDASFGPRINEIGVAITYIMMRSKQPIEDASLFISSVCQLLSLSEEEIEVLPSIISTRLCVSVLNSAYAKSNNSDSDYILVSEETAWQLLKKWGQWNPKFLINRFKEAANLPIVESSEDYNKYLDKRNKTFGPSLKLSYKQPILMESGAFQYMYDNQNNAFLDAYNNIPILGHAHPAVSEAVSRQSRLLYTNSRYLSKSNINYAEKLLSYFPDELDTVFFVNSGTEANELATRIVSTVTQKSGRIVLEMGYHGHSNSAIDISPYKYNGKGGQGKPCHILELPLPKLHKGKYQTGEAYAEEAILNIKQEIEKGKSFSSFIFEPISGCGGQVPLADGYLKQVTKFCKENKILTISDEVQIGFGRLGEWFWGFEMNEIIPDLVVLGKPMGNGFPLAAVVTTSEIAAQFDNGMEFFSSFAGNQIATEVGIAVLNTIENEGLQQHAYELGTYFKSQLTALKNNYPAMGDVRGSGFFLGIEFNDMSNLNASEVASIVSEGLRSKCILTSTDGMYNETLKIKGPLCFTFENADYFCDKLEQILKSL